MPSTAVRLAVLALAVTSTSGAVAGCGDVFCPAEFRAEPATVDLTGVAETEVELTVLAVQNGEPVEHVSLDFMIYEGENNPVTKAAAESGPDGTATVTLDVSLDGTDDPFGDDPHDPVGWTHYEAEYAPIQGGDYPADAEFGCADPVTGAIEVRT